MNSIDVADDVLQHFANVPRADEDRPCAGEGFPTHCRQLWVPPHRVLELRAVRLHRIRGSGRGGYRRAHQDMVGEDEICGQVLTKRGRIGLDVLVTLARA